MKYEFERQLDNLLEFFASQKDDHVTNIKEIPVKFQNNNLFKLLSSLEHLGFVIPFSFDFKDGRGPAAFPYLYTVTPAGVHFANTSSFVENAKTQKKERQLFNFKYFTMGWDTAIALLALIVAIVALIKSCK
jgi:hypothetical protein